MLWAGMVICVKVDNYHSEGMQYSLDRHQPILTCCVGPTVSVTSAMIDCENEIEVEISRFVCVALAAMEMIYHTVVVENSTQITSHRFPITCHEC